MTLAEFKEMALILQLQGFKVGRHSKSFSFDIKFHFRHKETKVEKVHKKILQRKQKREAILLNMRLGGIKKN